MGKLPANRKGYITRFMDKLNLLYNKLNQLENRLQIIVEGSTARLIQSKSDQNNLPLRMVSAMKNGIQTDSTGTPIAPNLFTLVIHPSDAAVLLENKSLLNELADVIHQSGIEAGLSFLTKPIIKIKTDPQLRKHQLDILVESRPGTPGKTTTVAVDLNAGDESVPPGAFLLVGGDRVYSLSDQVINIGRRVDNNLVIEDNRVSRLHAQLRSINGKFVIFDLDSTGGTHVNNELIQQHTLESGDVISLAGFHLVYGDEEFTLLESDLDSTRPLDTQ